MAANDLELVFGANIAGLIAGMEEAKASIEGLRAPVDTFVSSLSGVAEAIGAAFAVEKIKEFAVDMAEMGERALNTAYILGQSVGDYEQLRGALRILGVNADEAQHTIERLGKSVQQVEVGNKAAVAAYHNLHITTQEVSEGSKNLSEFLGLVISRFQQLEPQLRNVGLLYPILGRGIDTLAGAFRAGAAGFEEAMRAAEDYRRASEENDAGMAQTAESMNKLGNDVTTLAKDSFGLLKPAIDTVVMALDSIVGAADGAVRSIHDFMNELSKQNVFTNFIQGVRDIGEILGIIADFFNHLTKESETFGKVLHEIFVGIFNVIKALVSGGDIPAAFAAMMESIKAVVRAGSNDMVVYVQDAINRIKSIVSGFSAPQGITLPPVNVEAPRGHRQAGTEGPGKGGGDAAKKAYEDFAAEMRLEIAEADKDWNQISAIYERWAARAKEQFGATSKEFREVLLAMTRAHQQHINQMFSQAEQGYSAMKSIDDSYLKAFEENMKALTKHHQISKEQQYGFDIEYLAKLHDEERKRLEDMISNDQFTVEQKTRIYQQLLELDARYTAQLATLNELMIQKENQEWESFFSSLGSQFTGLISGMVTGGETLRQGLKKVFDGILSDFIKLIGDMVAKWAAMQLSGGATSSLSTALATMMGGGAGGAGGGIGGLLGGLPLIGPLLGGGAAMTGDLTAGTVAMDALMAIPFAKRGWEIPSFAGGGMLPSGGRWNIPSFADGGILANVHAGEMILPPDLSEGMKSMIRSGGGGGGTINIHAMDTQTGAQFLMKNRNTVGQAFRQASLTGGMSSRQLSNGRGSTGRF